jgi:DNA gyrase inhibitor GyrI
MVIDEVGAWHQGLDLDPGEGSRMRHVMTNPRIEQRAEQPYAGIRARVTMDELGRIVPPLWPEVFGWLAQWGVAPAGPPFLRYLVVDMEGELEVEAGVPVATPVAGDGRVEPGVLPAGQYAALVHTGLPEDLAGANAELQRWGAENGVLWEADGDTWGGRIEWSLTDPAQEPDRGKWRTEVAYLMAGDQAV